MRIFVKAKPLAKEEGIDKIDEIHFVVAVKEPPVRGEANKAIARVLAEHFGVSLGQVDLVSGFSLRDKVFKIRE